MRLHGILLWTFLAAASVPAAAQVPNTYCAANPAACQPVLPGPAYGGYGGYPAYAGPGYMPNGYGPYVGPGPSGYYGGYPPPGVYGGYPPPGYYGSAQAQALGALTYGAQALPGQSGPPPMQPDALTQTTAPVPPHPQNADLSRYSADIFGDANRPAKVVQKNGRTAGIQAGYVEELNRIADYLATPEIGRRLDAKYPFETLLIEGHIVPPVISELRDVKQVNGSRTIQTALGSFEIVRQARLAVAPPSWRDYLIVPSPPGSTGTWTPPKGAEEQANWDAGYKAGLGIGVEQARFEFDANFDRLDRDLAGMRRYHDLAQQGAVSLPVTQVRSTASRIGRGGRSAKVGEQTIDLVVSPKFQRLAAPKGG
ncbi:type IV secretory system conjugative DNA transfer family protein [Methylobacterium sp. 22177]|uniref:type IV secretory system conjugative DNA transfer family protein n=1 Tax=Methylobacterium sp. 22177 TaxID=3453885 RepID=UPI003F8553AE